MKKWPSLPALAFFLCFTAPGVQASVISDSIPPVMTSGLRYTIANTHSHNDYEQPVPFWTAYNAQFGSIEADIFHLPVRFWDAPDFPHAWQQLMKLRVDFINTDHIRQLADYLNTQ